MPELGRQGASRRPTPGPVRIPTGGGAPLAPAQLSAFERSFGADLSAVRVHTEAEAAAAAQSFGARAFTQGTHVYFAANAYAPGTAEGDRLLSHELVHVVQGQEGRTASGEGVSAPGDALEREAYGQEAAIAAQLHKQPEGEEEEQADAPASGPAEGGEVLRMPQDAWEPKGAVPLSDALDCETRQTDTCNSGENGSGPWGTKLPTPGDFSQLMFASALINAAEIYGFVHAARHMRHYLANTGAPLEIDLNLMRGQDSDVNSALEGAVASVMQQSKSHLEALGYCDEEADFTVPAFVVPVHTRKDTDWYYAVGAADLEIQTEAHLDPDGIGSTSSGEAGDRGTRPSQGSVTLFLHFRLVDSYDWDEGKVASLEAFGFSLATLRDEEMGRLHVAGLAQEYPIVGDLDYTLTVPFKYSDPEPIQSFSSPSDKTESTVQLDPPAVGEFEGTRADVHRPMK